MNRDASASCYYALIILKYLFENSDEQHRLTLQQIVEGIDHDPTHALSPSVDTVNAVVRHLEEYGFDIQPKKRNNKRPGSYLGKRYFEPWEIHLFADAVVTNQSLDKESTQTLITKLLRYLGPSYAQGKEDFLKYLKYTQKSTFKEGSHNLAVMKDAILKKTMVTYLLPGQDAQKHLLKRIRANPYYIFTKDNIVYVLLSEDNGEQKWIVKVIPLDQMIDVKLLSARRIELEALPRLKGRTISFDMVYQNPWKFDFVEKNYYVFRFENEDQKNKLLEMYAPYVHFFTFENKQYADVYSGKTDIIGDLLSLSSKGIELIFPFRTIREVQRKLSQMKSMYENKPEKEMELHPIGVERTFPGLRINKEQRKLIKEKQGETRK